MTQWIDLDGHVRARGSAADARLHSCTKVRFHRPLPCYTILVHGVNDLGTAYDEQEAGVVRGLNTRLDRSATLASPQGDLQAASYRTDLAKHIRALAETNPAEAERIRSDPDTVLYRRIVGDNVNPAYSGVIPFYWGYREEEGDDPRTLKPHIKKSEWHGQWLDRHGNRLDKDGSSGGGPFSNATTNLPDFWAEGIDPMLATPLDLLKRDPVRPMRPTPDRRYVVLAALRLAMVIQILRNKVEAQDAAINVIGHSQGCLIALLAQAILAERKVPLADCLILQHPPYSLYEPTLERAAAGAGQQTSLARLATLLDIVRAVGESGQARARAVPLDRLGDQAQRDGMVGPHWRPDATSRKSHRGAGVTFTERDNRGKVYLYFCPHDETVSLRNVQGIGGEGLPEEMQFEQADAALLKNTRRVLTHPSARTLRQRVFWQPPREAPRLIGVGEEERIALPRTRGGLLRTLPTGQMRRLNGEPLNPACSPTIGPDQLPLDAIDASIALTSSRGLQLRRPSELRERVADPRLPQQHGYPMTREEEARVKAQVQARYDAEAQAQSPHQESWREYRREVLFLHAQPDGMLQIECLERPIDTRERIEGLGKVENENSYHSAIPSQAIHHEQVTAYDLAIGAPIPRHLELGGWLDYVRAVADWRTEWNDGAAPKGKTQIPIDDVTRRERLRRLLDEESNVGAKALIDATSLYYSTGKIPRQVYEVPPLNLVTSQTISARTAKQAPIRPFTAGLVVAKPSSLK